MSIIPAPADIITKSEFAGFSGEGVFFWFSESTKSSTF